MRKLWGGAFEGDSNDLVDAFGESLESDLTFWREDVEGSIAHATMLGSTGILTEDEANLLVKGLEQILADGPSTLPTDVEDIHTAVEVRLQELVGEVAGKLHTARSRNDQVATDTRLYLRKRLEGLRGRLKELQGTLLEQAEVHRESLMPGYTHQQPAQPITLGYHLMAHFWAYQRHGRRVEHLLEMISLSPLGSAALAGSGFPIDRHQTADTLGFEGPIPNALDATSDRSFVLDTLHVTALIMLDLSRIAQEIVMWSGREFGFVRLDDAVTTGSSIMPQKRNPDMAELIRGRTGRAIGNWTAFAATMKAMPLGYNRDTQDDKPGMFESLDLCESSLRLTALMVRGAVWNLERMRSAASTGFSTATDLADFLAASGIPFRKAHEMVGKVVKECASRGIELDALDAPTLKEIDAEIPAEALDVLKAEDSVKRRESFGGPGPQAIAAQLSRARELHVALGFDRIS